MCTSPVQYGTNTTEWSANGLRSSATSKTPPASGPSVMVGVYRPLSGAQVAAEKQLPPSWRKRTTLLGSASRSQKLNSEPSAHWQSPPGAILCQPAASTGAAPSED